VVWIASLKDVFLRHVRASKKDTTSSRPATWDKRLSLTPNGNVCCQLKTPRDATTHVIFEPVDFVAQLAFLVPKPCVKSTTFHGVFGFIVFSMDTSDSGSVSAY
jgi:hypothetical protein